MDNSELVLEEFLALNRKDSIEQSCDFFQVDYRKSWSRKKMAQALGAAIRKEPIKLFFALPEEGLRFLASLFRKKGSMDIDPLKQTYKPKDHAEFLDTMDLLTLFGLVRLNEASGGEPVVKISVPYELKKIMAPFVTKEKRDFSKSLDMMADIVRGLLYYYGVLEMGTLVDMMMEKVPSFQRELCRPVVRVRAPLGGRVRLQEVAGREYVVGFDAVDMAVGTEQDFVEKLVQTVEERTDFDYKTFSTEALLEAAQDVFLENEEEYEDLLHDLWGYFIVDGSYLDEAGEDVTFLTDQLTPEMDFQFFMDNLVADMRRTGDVPRALRALEDNMDFPTKRERLEVFGRFISFTDTISRFEYKGYSPLEMEGMGKGKARKAIPQKRSQKIGRNDLCPCGSGKKYKNCHGSGQNLLN